jgi:CheY-like chemotaxis protein
VAQPDVADRLTLLIVDDNDDARATLAALLDRTRFDVQTASDAQSALALIERAPPRAVLLDIGLPVQDGYQLALQLRQRYSSAAMTLIAVTGYGSDDARRRSREAGFDYHLTKPVDVDAIQALLYALSR